MAFRILSKSVRLLCLAGTVLFVWGSYAPARAAQIYTINNTDTEVRVSFTVEKFMLYTFGIEQGNHRTGIVRPYSSNTLEHINFMLAHLIGEVSVYEFGPSISTKSGKYLCEASLPADSTSKKYYFVRVTLNQSSPGDKITCDFFFR
ncbi:MAG: hypothetical protein ACNI3A_02870 [Desulfovibrio sp.]|uniref:hypothetical protein n=1 Tax=Desulfovibrio sp. 7SRBS1 TaxID=3378064 RepID=UPI003B3DE8D6